MNERRKIFSTVVVNNERILRKCLLIVKNWQIFYRDNYIHFQSTSF